MIKIRNRVYIRLKPIVMSNLFYILNILAIFNNVFDPNQVYLIVLSFCLYKTANIYHSIYKKENMQNLVKLNILYILTYAYNKNQANNIFH